MKSDVEIQNARNPFVVENARFYRVALKNTAREFMTLFNKAKTIEEQTIILDNELLPIANNEFQKAYNKMWARTPVYFAVETFKGLTNTKALNDIFNPINAFKPLLQQRIAQVSLTTYKNYSDKLTKASRRSNDIAQIAKLFNTSIRGAYIRLRAIQISRTETVFASNVGRRSGALATNLPLLKTWVTMDDDLVRSEHAVMNGVTIPINDFYIVGGEAMLFPSDFTNGATAKNLVNCRCAEFYTIIK